MGAFLLGVGLERIVLGEEEGFGRKKEDADNYGYYDLR
jgi:hypothetical protein